jgi:hypothetical protein
MAQLKLSILFLLVTPFVPLIIFALLKPAIERRRER